MPQSLIRKVTVALPNFFSSARAVIFLIASSQVSPLNSGEFNGLTCEDAIKKMTARAEEKKFGKATVTFRIKDWGISRQRYWGTPIPMVYCDKDGVVPVAEKDLPIILPDNVPITLAGGSP